MLHLQLLYMLEPARFVRPKVAIHVKCYGNWILYSQNLVWGFLVPSDCLVDPDLAQGGDQRETNTSHVAAAAPCAAILTAPEGTQRGDATMGGMVSALKGKKKKGEPGSLNRAPSATAAEKKARRWPHIWTGVC